MKKSLILSLFLLLTFTIGCFEDTDSTGSSDGSGAFIKIKVSSDIYSYPLKNGTNYEAYSGDTLYTWQYSEVSGTDTKEKVCYSNKIKETTTNSSGVTTYLIGSRKLYVYIYSKLGEGSDSTPVLYKTALSANGGEQSINVAANGTYYIVAFYDYTEGGDQENILNRMDRYAIYTSSANGINAATNLADSSSNSTPFADKAASVTVERDETVEITMTIGKDWLIGKPKVPTGDTGRIFLKST